MFRVKINFDITVNIELHWKDFFTSFIGAISKSLQKLSKVWERRAKKLMKKEKEETSDSTFS